VHSFCAKPTPANRDWVLTVTDYGEQRYISTVQKGNVMGAQFHPEKSGTVGLAILDSFLSRAGKIGALTAPGNANVDLNNFNAFPATKLAKRVIACLDVRSNDAGDLVVTKGDQYDVRESAGSGEK
jgi:imidazole glycerol-phosphate synthase